MTGNELVRASMRLLGVLASGETPSAQEYADGIEAANLMIDSWATQKLTVLAFTEVQATMNGAASYTVAAGGNFATAQPARIEWAYFRDTDGNDDQLDELSGARWATITDKDSEGDPTYFYYQGGTIRFWPEPQSGTVRIGVWAPLTAITTGAAEMTLGPGYAEAMKYSLALRLAPEFEREAPASLVAMSVQTLGNVKRSNHRPNLATSDLAPVTRSNILTDE